MQSRSRKSLGRARKTKAELSRPFDREILRQARGIAARYSIVLEPNDEVGYLGRSVELPNVFAHGKTAERCVRETLEAMVSVVAVMLEDGEPPPKARITVRSRPYAGHAVRAH